MTTNVGLMLAGEWHVPRRAAIFNLSARLRAFDKALADLTKPPPPPPTGLAAKIIRAGAKARGEQMPKRRGAKRRGDGRRERSPKPSSAT
jgi:hypothetical protein